MRISRIRLSGCDAMHDVGNGADELASGAEIGTQKVAWWRAAMVMLYPGGVTPFGSRPRPNYWDVWQCEAAPGRQSWQTSSGLGSCDRSLVSCLYAELSFEAVRQFVGG